MIFVMKCGMKRIHSFRISCNGTVNFLTPIPRRVGKLHNNTVGLDHNLLIVGLSFLSKDSLYAMNDYFTKTFYPSQKRSQLIVLENNVQNLLEKYLPWHVQSALCVKRLAMTVQLCSLNEVQRRVQMKGQESFHVSHHLVNHNKIVKHNMTSFLFDHWAMDNCTLGNRDYTAN